ncbi:MAG TPA: hypothetical protein DCQ04_13290 [Actinobacteria bacterium]|nr:hypothetical protein [Actinomycetota bacterium]
MKLEIPTLMLPAEAHAALLSDLHSRLSVAAWHASKAAERIPYENRKNADREMAECQRQLNDCERLLAAIRQLGPAPREATR